MAVVTLGASRNWECPNCSETAITAADVPNRFHRCGGLRGLVAPMVRAGIRAKVEAREREDYVGAELVQVDAAGRPVMSVVTTRDDGMDVAVFAPCATGKRD
jgi:hypothetical protein